MQPWWFGDHQTHGGLGRPGWQWQGGLLACDLGKAAMFSAQCHSLVSYPDLQEIKSQVFVKIWLPHASLWDTGTEKELRVSPVSGWDLARGIQSTAAEIVLTACVLVQIYLY